MANIKQFYKELGRLLYSVAMADGKVQEEEIKMLHKLISGLAFSEATSDSSGMNHAFYAEFEFEKYVKDNVKIKEACDSFINFLNSNVADLDPILISKSVDAIEKIADAFNKVSEEEREVINKVKKEILEITEIF